MALKSYLYASKALQAFSREELNLLEKQAYENNLLLGISGYLYFEKETFIQYIEGEASALDELYSRIDADPRHEIFRKVEGPVSDKRRFPDWSMRWLKGSELTEIKLENLIIDQMKIMSELGDRGPDFSSTAFRLVDTLSQNQGTIPRQ